MIPPQTAALQELLSHEQPRKTSVALSRATKPITNLESEGTSDNPRRTLFADLIHQPFFSFRPLSCTIIFVVSVFKRCWGFARCLSGIGILSTTRQTLIDVGVVLIYGRAAPMLAELKL